MKDALDKVCSMVNRIYGGAALLLLAVLTGSHGCSGIYKVRAGFFPVGNGRAGTILFYMDDNAGGQHLRLIRFACSGDDSE